VAFDVNDPNDHLMEEYIEKEKKKFTLFHHGCKKSRSLRRKLELLKYN